MKRASGEGDVTGLPPLAAEDHVCSGCGLDYARITVERAGEVIASIPDSVRAAVVAVPLQERRKRPAPGVWSVAEYVCHLRDVHLTYTIRLHRARTTSAISARSGDRNPAGVLA